MSASASSNTIAQPAPQLCQLPPELVWGKTFLVARKADIPLRCTSAPATFRSVPSQQSASLQKVSSCATRIAAGDSEKFGDSDSMREDAPSADSFGIGDTVAATSDFRIAGVLAVEKGCRGTVLGHGERPDGRKGASIQFEPSKDGREANVLCQPHEIQVVAKAPSADSFLIGDSVAAASEFCIGGMLAVEKGCMGTVVGHGERPDGRRGVSIQFQARKDRSDANVLCQPHELQAVPKAVHAQPVLELLESHLRRAWQSTRASATSFRVMLPSLPSPVQPKRRSYFGQPHVQCMPAESMPVETIPPERGAASSSPLKRRKVKPRKVNERTQHVDEDDWGDDLDNIQSDTPQQHHRWSVLIVVLLFANVLLAYMHIQRHAGKNRKHNLMKVKVLTDHSFSEHIDAHPDGTLVNFFASPCQPCAKLVPELEEAAKQLQKTTNVSLVSVNAALASTISKRYVVTKVPTLLWFRRGRLPRDVTQSLQSAAEIVEFAHESLQPAVIEFGSYAEFLGAVPQLRTVLSKGKSPPIVAGFGSDPNVHKVLEEVAERFRGETAFLFVPDAPHDESSIRALFRDAATDKDYGGSLTVPAFMNWLQPFMEVE